MVLRFCRALVLTALATATTACGTLTAARPLDKGETLVGATVLGPLTDFGAPIPIPMVVVEGRHGTGPVANRAFDLGYGLNLTALPFGVTQGHVGAAWLLIEQNEGRPALALTNRVFFGITIPGGPDRENPQVQAWGLDQIELIASWQVQRTLPYVSLSQYFDFGSPELLLTPAAGVQVDPGEPGGFVVQGELRWFGINNTDDRLIPSWIPGRPGALGVFVSGAARFGGSR